MKMPDIIEELILKRGKARTRIQEIDQTVHTLTKEKNLLMELVKSVDQKLKEMDDGNEV